MLKDKINRPKLQGFLIFALAILLSFRNSSADNAEDILKGKILFKEKGCNVCHAISPKQKSSLRKKAPYLPGSTRRSFEWLYNFLRDPKSALANDEKLAELSKKFDSPMKRPKNVSKEERKLIIAFLISIKK